MSAIAARAVALGRTDDLLELRGAPLGGFELGGGLLVHLELGLQDADLLARLRRLLLREETALLALVQPL